MAATSTTCEYLLLLLLLLTATHCLAEHPSSATFPPAAKSDSLSAPVSFYQQLRPIHSQQHLTDFAAESINIDHYLSDDVFTPPTIADDNDYQFNQLWMQQFQQEYRYREGSAAAGKLLRMGIRAFYNAYQGGSVSLVADNDISSSLYQLDYNVRLSSNKLKVGVEYQF